MATKSKSEVSSAPIASLVPASLADDSQELNLFKTWLTPPAGEGFPMVGVRPIKRSDDVSELFPDQNGKVSERGKYVWACMAIHDVSIEAGLFQCARSPVGVKEGDIFFMFENAALRDAFHAAARSNGGLLIGSTGLEMMQTRAGKFRVRQWVARRVNKEFFYAKDAIAALPMPATEETAHYASKAAAED